MTKKFDPYMQEIREDDGVENTTSIGTLSSLTTTVKTNLVGAINEVKAGVGTLANLTTTAKTNTVEAINELNAEIDNAVTNASNESTITLGAATTTQTATIQLKNLAGADIDAVQKVQVYMCTDSAGAIPSEAGSNDDVIATTGKIIKAITAKLHFDVVTDANGVAVLSFDNTGGSTYTDRVVLVLPSGGVVVSDALAVLGA